MEDSEKERHAASLLQPMDQWESFNRMEIEASGRFDKWIVTLAGGALVLSVNFIREIAPKAMGWTIWCFLVPSWGLLILTVILVLWAQLEGQAAIHRERERLTNYVLNELKSVATERESHAAQLAWLLTRVSLCSFCLGMVLLCAFAVGNLGGGRP